MCVAARSAASAVYRDSRGHQQDPHPSRRPQHRLHRPPLRTAGPTEGVARWWSTSLLLLGAAREDTAAFGAHLLRMLGPSAPTEHSGARDFTVGVRLGEPRRCLDKRLSSAAERYAVRAIAPFPRLDRENRRKRFGGVTLRPRETVGVRAEAAVRELRTRVGRAPTAAG